MQSGKRKILSNKFYLYLTEFFAGMSVMAVELGASRLLAPYFSSSQIVWTIIIGTIMIAMALGNIYGGRAADKNPDPDKLYARIILAAIWIALIPAIGKYVIIGISVVMIFSVNHMFLIWAAFAACMVVFVFPLFLLGTVTPSLVKYTVEDLGDSGKTVGMLNASNTIGSIIGTFVPTFVTIPAVGTSITFLVFAGILLALAILYFISPKEKMVQEVLLKEGHPFIYIADNGFRDYYKPAGNLFDAVAAGGVLILSPWPYDPNKKRVTKAECVQMNKMAEEIASSLSAFTIEPNSGENKK